MRQLITGIIDFFYPPFRKLMPLQTFRYAACGGGNVFIGLLTYFVAYRYVFAKEIFDFGFFAFKPHIAALFLSAAFTFILGFLLNRYVVFTSSNLRGRIQLFRYFLSFTFNLLVNYGLLKLFVEIFHWKVFASQAVTTVIVIVVSYLTQRHFTFRVKKDGHAEFTDLH